MRPLWKIEREILDITAEQYPESSEALKKQIVSAQVVKFENTGAGFFSHLYIDPARATVVESSPLIGAYGNVLGIEHGMGFIVFLREGRLWLVEGYTHGNVTTVGFDFEKAVFGLTPWGPRTGQEA
jgi:hypothetical protein